MDDYEALEVVSRLILGQAADSEFQKINTLSITPLPHVLRSLDKPVWTDAQMPDASHGGIRTASWEATPGRKSKSCMRRPPA